MPHPVGIELWICMMCLITDNILATTTPIGKLGAFVGGRCVTFVPKVNMLHKYTQYNIFFIDFF